MTINMIWADFKAQLQTGIPFRYISTGGVYYLTAGDDLFSFECIIPQNGSADQTDFETNYKSHGITFNLSPLAPGKYQNITGNSTVTVKSTFGVLMGIWINNNSTGGVITLYDNTAASGTVIAAIQVATPSGGLLSSNGIPAPISFPALNVFFTTGLTVVTSGSTSNNITIVYR